MTDKNLMNALLRQKGEKKAEKSEREIFFKPNRMEIAREFIWQIKRIHHWWNCSGEGNNNDPL